VNDSTNNSGNTRPKRNWLFPLGVAAIAICSVVVVSCFHDDDPATTSFDDGSGGLPVVNEGPSLEVSGTGLACDSVAPLATTDASVLRVSDPAADDDNLGIAKHNVSYQVEMGDVTNQGSWNNHNAANNLKRLSAIVPGQTPDGEVAVDDEGVAIGDVHPLLVSYGEQVIGAFEGGDGSADVGDPDNIDDIFVSLSMDNGKSWKKFNSVSDTADKSSKSVSWDNLSTIYPGHSMKPTMAIQGNNILVAWNDKYCPSGDPFDLIVDGTDGELVDPEQPDLYKVNGAQGTIDYGGIVALPNDKTVYEVPFSCVWTARGEFVLDPEGDGSTNYTIQWRKAQQLTSGTRDSNKIWIAPAEVGFAITWQEDPVGLRPGKGEGPGAGWSGATTNHGADIWYTYIDMEFFDDVCTDADCTTTNEDPAPLDILNLAEKPKPAVNFTYPVRISNNEICVRDDTKLYCDPAIVPDNCISYVSVTSNSGKTTERCVQNDLDYMVMDSTIQPEAAILDGDTGQVYLHEHGPRGGDEINVIAPGLNYGWPAITYGRDYSGAHVSPFTEADGMEQPLLYWVPSIAPSGMAWYGADVFPAWRGDLMIGALVDKEVRRVDIEDGQVIGEQSLFKELDARIRDVRVGIDGHLYLLTDGEDGKLIKVSPADQ